MKKLFCLILAIIFIISFTACKDTNNKDDNKYIESETNEAVYEKAIKLIDEKKFSDAIELLEEISEYNDSKTLLFKANYIEGCISFNNRDFFKAYECFDAAKEILENNNISKDMASSKEILVYTASNRNESAYHCGVELVNKGNHVPALNYFEEVYNINSNAEKHMEQIISQLLDGNWIGNCTVENVQFQVEMSFDKDAQTLFVHWVDRRYGYKSITSAKGSLKIYADKAVFSDGVNRTELIFDFYDVNKMRISCNGTHEEKALYEGTYEQKSSIVPKYKITITEYPTYDIPDFYNFSINKGTSSENDVTSSNNTNSNTIGQPNSSSQKENNNNPYNSKDNTNENNNTSSKNNVNSESQATGSNYNNNSNYVDNSNNYENVFEKKDENKSEADTHTHSYSSATCTKPPTCSCGKTSGSALGHQFSSATCTQPEICKQCGTTRGNSLGCKYETNAPFYCCRCDNSNPNALKILREGLEVVSVEPAFAIKSYSISNFRLTKGGSPFGKYGYAFKFECEVKCLEEWNSHYTNQLDIVMYNENGSVLNDIYRMIDVMNTGDVEKISVNWIVYADMAVTRIEVGKNLLR